MKIASMNKQITKRDVEKFILQQFFHFTINKDKKKLVEFHTINKYLLMAYNQKELKILGNLISNLKNESIDKILEEYKVHLKIALSKEFTISSNVNVLNRIYSYFRKKMTEEEKEALLKNIEDFRKERISLGNVLNRIENYIRKYDNSYLARQTYYLIFSEVGDVLFGNKNLIQNKNRQLN